MTKQYLWSITDSDQLSRLYDSIDQAKRAAVADLEGESAKQSVDIFDARPATAEDADLFEGADEDDGGADTTQPEWWKDRWVPENIVETFLIEAK